MPQIEYTSPKVFPTSIAGVQITREEYPIEMLTSAFSAFQVRHEDIPESFARGMMELEMGLEIDMDEATGE